MIRKKFNDNWVVSSGAGSPLMELFQGKSKEETEVMLPHDAMIYEARTPDTQNGSQTGFYPGGDLSLCKKI